MSIARIYSVPRICGKIISAVWFGLTPHTAIVQRYETAAYIESRPENPVINIVSKDERLGCNKPSHQASSPTSQVVLIQI